MRHDDELTVTLFDPDVVDVAVVTLELDDPVNKKHAEVTARVLTWALLLTAGVGAAFTAFSPGILRGPTVMNGSARGTALLVLFVALPCITFGIRRAARGSGRGRVLWAGGLAYVLYNAVLFCFATPFNPLFLNYVATLGLALWALLMTVASTAFDDQWRAESAKGVAAYVFAVVALNVAAWLAQIVPELNDKSPAFLHGTGMTTNPVYIQDLAFWLPLMTAAALMLWTSHAWGLLLAGTGLVFWQLEALGVAVDQLAAHVAAPGSSVASLGGAVLFAGLFALGLIPTWATLKRLR